MTTIPIAPHSLRAALFPKSTLLTNGALAFGGVTFLALMAQLALPIPGSPVPVTGQTLGALLIGASYGRALGATTFALYLGIGIAGAPVFSQQGHGLAKLVGPTGKVFAFEPHKDNFDLLKKNIEINGYQNIIAENKAISNNTGKSKFYLGTEFYLYGALFKPPRFDDVIDVHTITLDDYFKNFKKKIDFIKMDICGGEGRAFQGMNSVLHTNPHVKLFHEWWPWGITQYGISNPEEHIQLLEDNDYKLFKIDGKENAVIQTSVKELIKTYTISEKEDTNLFCTKENYEF